jgi:3D (Asp-Asp-Asp) domain-containing protein
MVINGNRMKKLLIKVMLCFLFFFCNYHPPPVWAARHQKHIKIKRVAMPVGDKVPVTVTMYSSQSPENGTITASGQKVRRGIIAVSRDLESQWKLKFGDLVELEGIGTFQVQDRMNSRWTKRVDIWVPTEKEAATFGKQTTTLIVLGKDENPGGDDA